MLLGYQLLQDGNSTYESSVHKQMYVSEYTVQVTLHDAGDTTGAKGTHYIKDNVNDHVST